MFSRVLVELLERFNTGGHFGRQRELHSFEAGPETRGHHLDVEIQWNLLTLQQHTHKPSHGLAQTPVHEC